MDDIENYQPAVFEELDISLPNLPRAPPPPPTRTKRKANDGLGLDDEVEVRKTRVYVKLDENRLLSINGLPRLWREAPKELRFSNKKGYEYKDAARLLAFYQLWADDLFKKGRFRDTLKKIEKLGHTRAVQKQRLAYIEERRKEKRREDRRKNGVGEEDSEEDLYTVPTIQKAPAPPPTTTGAPPPTTDGLFLWDGQDSDEEMDEPDDDVLEALRAEAANTLQATVSSTRGLVAATQARDEFDDEMEAMEEFERSNGGGGSARTAPPRPRDEFDDDMEAMEEFERGNGGGSAPPPGKDTSYEDELEAMEAMGHVEKSNAPAPSAPPAQDEFDDGFPDDEAMEALALFEKASTQEKAPAPALARAQTPEEDEDDMEAMAFMD